MVPVAPESRLTLSSDRAFLEVERSWTGVDGASIDF